MRQGEHSFHDPIPARRIPPQKPVKSRQMTAGTLCNVQSAQSLPCKLPVPEYAVANRILPPADQAEVLQRKCRDQIKRSFSANDRQSFDWVERPAVGDALPDG
jgi:hypothetical protein